MGVEFVKGLQGDDPRYLKVVATPKHYAVHSGPEPDRHTFDAQTELPLKKDLNTITLTPKQISLLDENYRRVVEPGLFEVAVGGKQPGFKGYADARTTEVLTAQFEVVGKAVLTTNISCAISTLYSLTGLKTGMKIRDFG